MSATRPKDLELPASGQAASYISGWGHYVPEKVVDNNYFASYLDTSDEWIRERTGIIERRWAEPGTGPSELAEPAARMALEKAGLSVADVDGIVFATVTPDHLFPSAGCMLQRRLGMRHGFAYDVNAVCTGFLYALVTADGLIRSGAVKNLLVVGAEVFSTIVNREDRGACVLFGDGAGAVLLSRNPDASSDDFYNMQTAPAKNTGRGIYTSELRSDGHHRDILGLYCGSALAHSRELPADKNSYIHMAGREVFKLAVRSISEVCESVLERSQVAPAELSHFVTHQANKRIMDAVAKQLKLSPDKVPVNVDKYGNTSAASVPILLSECAEEGRFKDGDWIMLSAFGAGVTWGSVLLRW